MKKSFLIYTLSIILFYILIFIYPKTFFIYIFLFIILYTNIHHKEGNFISKFKGIFIDYIKSIKRTYLLNLIPVLLFISYSFYDVYLYLISLIILAIYIFLFFKSFIIFNKKSLYLSSSKEIKELGMFDIYKYLPSLLTLQSYENKQSWIISMSNKYKDKLKKSLYIKYPDIIIKESKKKNIKFKYKKYFFIHESYNYYQDIINYFKNFEDIEFSFYIANPYNFKDKSFVILIVKSNSKKDILLLKTHFKKKDSNFFISNKNIDNIFKISNSKDNINSINENNFNIKPSSIFFKKDINLGFYNNKKVYIPKKYFNNHSYIIGKTGVGKSSFMKNLIIENIKLDEAVVLIDPHNLAEKVFNSISSLKKKVVYIDFIKNKYSINLLDVNKNENIFLKVDLIISLFKDLYKDFWGPQTEDILRRSLLALMYSNSNKNILDIEEFLTDDHFRLKLLQSVDDKDTLDYFHNVFARWDNRSRTERISPILNKIGRLKSDKIVSDFISGNTSFDLSEEIDNKSIIIFSLNKRLIGEDNSKFLGSLILNQIRYDLFKNEKSRVHIYIDEFQNFLSDSFLFLLSEGRKFGISLTLSNQYLEQIEKKHYDNIIENTSNFYIFNTGAFTRKILSVVLGYDIPSDMKEFLVLAKIGNNNLFTFNYKV